MPHDVPWDKLLLDESDSSEWDASDPEAYAVYFEGVDAFNADVRIVEKITSGLKQAICTKLRWMPEAVLLAKPHSKRTKEEQQSLLRAIEAARPKYKWTIARTNSEFTIATHVIDGSHWMSMGTVTFDIQIEPI